MSNLCRLVKESELRTLERSPNLQRFIVDKWKAYYSYSVAGRRFYNNTSIKPHMIDALNLIDSLIRDNDFELRLASFCTQQNYVYDDVVSFLARFLWEYPTISNEELVRIGFPQH